MMPEANPFAAALRGALLVVFALTTACSTTRGPDSQEAGAGAVRGEAGSLQAAQAALREGDCRKAAEHYVAAARASTQVEVAQRATQLALGCKQLPSARTATARWRELDPYSGDAALAAAVVAMKRYDMEEAREALAAWNNSGQAGNQDPLSFAQALQEEGDPTLVYRLFQEVLLGEDPAPEVLLAQARLALAGFNMQAAIDAAQRALDLVPNFLEARILMLRAMSVMGLHQEAIEGARELPLDALDGEDAFLLADLMLGAGLVTDAEQELERLTQRPGTATGAYRRLITQGLRTGRYEDVEQRLKQLVEADRGNTALAVYYLAQLAERRGDPVQAVQSYRLLADTAMGLTARSSAARLMIKEGLLEEALQLLDEYSAQNFDEALETGLARAHLQVDAGDLRGALATLDDLAKRYPGHPDIDYTRATVLESGGRTRDAVAEFERALKLRPEDPQLLNALGYTLADHNMRLKDAEQYVRKALEVSPDNPAIQDSLGWVLYRRGQPQSALQVLERAWNNSHDAEIGSHFGEVLWSAGEEGRARYVWAQVLTSAPDHEPLKQTIRRLTGEDVEGG